MPTQKQRLVNLTQTARHEVKMDTSTFLILTHWSPGLFFPRSDRGFRTLGGPWSSIISTHLRPIIILRFFRQKTACPRDIFDDDAAAAIDIDAATYETEETTTTTDNIETTCVQEGGGGGVVPRGNCAPDPVSTPIDVSGNFFFRPDD